MFEKVNPSHPDKVADRIAGALIDLAYRMQDNPKMAIEVLLGHDQCIIISEGSVNLPFFEVNKIVSRISKATLNLKFYHYPQDVHLADNQKNGFKCGDNGIFKGVPLTDEQIELTKLVKNIYEKYPFDGKYIMDGEKTIICQSHAKQEELRAFCPGAVINPLGEWTGGIAVDSGATNRKLGSDMGDSVTGGGLCGKDLSKADVSVNIYAFLKAQKEKRTVCMSCAIGDEKVDGVPFSEIVEVARQYIKELGGFEKFAEWGLVR